MSRFVRSSKVRHLFGSEEKERVSEVRQGRATGDHQYIKANALFWACSAAGGGGGLLVVPHTFRGKLPRSYPTINGHSAPIFDFDFNPFHQQMIATGSDDMTIKIWGIPTPEGLTDNINTPLLDLSGYHRKKVIFLTFNPVASNVLASASADHTVKLFDIEAGEEKWSGSVNDLTQDLKWNYGGNLLGTTNKDKTASIFDPRKGTEPILTWSAHQGSKASKFCWLGDQDKFVTVGFSKTSKRQFHIWDIKNTASPIHTHNIDAGAGVMLPFYDEGVNVLYIGAKGDGNIRAFEITDAAPWAFELSPYRSTKSQKGLAIQPKRVNNILGCEVTGFLKLHPTEVEHIAMTIPRKSDCFQDDIFPDAEAGIAGCTADEWFAGSTAKPVLTSLKPGEVTVTTNAEIKMKKSRSELEKELAAAHARIAELEAEVKKLKV